MASPPPPPSAPGQQPAINHFSTIPEGYKPVVAYAWEGKQSLKAMAAFIHEWARAFKQCGAELEKRAQQHPLPESEATSTLRQAYDTVKHSVQKMGLAMQEVNQIMDTDREAFVEMRHKQSTAKRECIKSYETSKKDLERARSNMNSLKKKYQSWCRNCEKYINLRNEAKNSSDDKAKAKLPKHESNLQHQVAGAIKAEKNYAQAVRDVHRLQKAHRTNTYKILNDLQALEHKRVEASKASLTLITRKHLSLCASIQTNFEQALKKINQVDARTDLDIFFSKAKRESKMSSPAPLVLEAYAHHMMPLLEQEGVNRTFQPPQQDSKPPPPASSGGGGGWKAPPPPTATTTSTTTDVTV
mmetsp:Transcript_31325/g.52977  ORF Transcript_31325/g.52977 Transcript_31325/m.52977 type:complete len:357 (-) Transcript_31325:470-1540(-)